MMTSVKTRSTRASDLNPMWHVIDAEGKTLGRVSTEIAVLLQGKHKPMYVPYLNTGDYVVVINAEKVRVTGKKLEQKVYYRHSGYHGGLTERTLKQLLEKTPARAITHSVKGMLPKNAMGRKMLSRLKVYTGSEHPHEAQLRGMEKAQARAAATAAPEPAAEAVEEAPKRPNRRRTRRPKED